MKYNLAQRIESVKIDILWDKTKDCNFFLWYSFESNLHNN
ncbi:MAG: hypothetical protein HeimC2_20520 [Candidatus Heimdallarchaeota archaeon LC_2]|nr:MAG: hypothetical protein HeimC2_20520 [Candidatus Heimdallarchaeota archaeon LC_2]